MKTKEFLDIVLSTPIIFKLPPDQAACLSSLCLICSMESGPQDWLLVLSIICFVNLSQLLNLSARFLLCKLHTLGYWASWLGIWLYLPSQGLTQSVTVFAALEHWLWPRGWKMSTKLLKSKRTFWNGEGCDCREPAAWEIIPGTCYV